MSRYHINEQNEIDRDGSDAKSSSMASEPGVQSTSRAAQAMNIHAILQFRELKLATMVMAAVLIEHSPCQNWALFKLTENCKLCKTNNIRPMSRSNGVTYNAEITQITLFNKRVAI